MNLKFCIGYDSLNNFTQSRPLPVPFWICLLWHWWIQRGARVLLRVRIPSFLHTVYFETYVRQELGPWEILDRTLFCFSNYLDQIFWDQCRCLCDAQNQSWLVLETVALRHCLLWRDAHQVSYGILTRHPDTCFYCYILNFTYGVLS